MLTGYSWKSARLILLAISWLGGCLCTAANAEEMEVIVIEDLLAESIITSATATYDDAREMSKAQFSLPQTAPVSAVKDGWIPLTADNGEKVYTEAMYVKRKRKVCDVAPGAASKHTILATGLGAGEGC